jgi:capsular exopolysaccharide synthesis family protein
MTLADHLRVVATSWWRILLIAVIVGALAYGYSNSQDKVYDSTTLLSVASGLGNNSSDSQSSDELSFIADYYSQIATTRPIAGAGAKAAGLPISESDAVSRISTVANSTPGFIKLRATGPTPRDAQQLAQRTAEALKKSVTADQERTVADRVSVFQDRIDGLRTQLDSVPAGSDQAQTIQNLINANQVAIADAESQLPFAITIVQPALANDAPVSPTPKRDATLAFLLAAIVAGEGLVIIRAFSDRFAKSQDAASIGEFTGLPVLAMIPRGRGPDVVEAFRTLRTNLLFLEGAGRPRTVAMVSPNPNSGKSFCAIHLAESAVAVDAEVVLVDADLRRPVIHSRVRVPREPGLSDALRGADMHHTVHCVEGIPNLKVMPSGSPVSDTVGVLGGRAFRGVLDQLDTAELVVVDTPPGAVYADALAVSAQCDATLVVLDAKSTRRRAARLLIDSLERTGATIIGVVVNNATYSRRDTYERG